MFKNILCIEAFIVSLSPALDRLFAARFPHDIDCILPTLYLFANCHDLRYSGNQNIKLPSIDSLAPISTSTKNATLAHPGCLH